MCPRQEMEFLASAKDVASGEATPHHLTLSAEDYPRLKTKMQMNPPVRAPEHRDAIWRGLQQGVVDVLGSDHAPHRLEEKAKPYPESPSGMTGVQTLVPIMLTTSTPGGSASALRRPDQRRAAAPVRNRRQGPHRESIRRRLHHRRFEAPRDDPQFLDRLALALDPLRRPGGDGLARWDLRARAPGDVGGRTHGAVDGRGGAVRMTATVAR